MKPIDLLNYDKSVIIRHMLICREKIRQQQTLIRKYKARLRRIENMGGFK